MEQGDLQSTSTSKPTTSTSLDLAQGVIPLVLKVFNLGAAELKLYRHTVSSRMKTKKT